MMCKLVCPDVMDCRIYGPCEYRERGTTVTCVCPDRPIREAERRVAEAVLGDDPATPLSLQPIGALQAILAEYEDALAEAISCGECEDPGAALTTLAEAKGLVANLRAALAALKEARGDA